MRQVILLSLVLTSIGASIADYEFKQRARPQLEKSSVEVGSIITEASATPSNSTYEDIIKELGLMYYLTGWSPLLRMRDCDWFPAGPFGGSGGNPFDELPNGCDATVSQISLRVSSWVYAIQLTYRYSDGTYHTGGFYGGGGGTGPHIDIVDLEGGERIVAILGNSNSVVNHLTFVTNKGRIFGPHGGSGRSRFKVESCNLHGIFGRSESNVKSIGFHCTHV